MKNDISPRLTLRVGVTGHRPNKLIDVDLATLEARIELVLANLASAIHSLQAWNDQAGEKAPFSRIAPELRLATSLAEGADRIATYAGIRQGYSLNVILPFPRAIYESDFHEPAINEFRQLLQHDSVQSCTELDLADEQGSRSGSYLEAGHLMLSHSDVLLAVWDEADADGRGGTGEIITEALKRELLVILVTLDGALKIWNSSSTAVDQFEEGIWQELIFDPASDAPAEELLSRLHQRLMPYRPLTDTPLSESYEAPSAGIVDFQSEQISPTGDPATFRILKSLMLGRKRRGVHQDERNGVKQSEPWIDTLMAAKIIGGATFSATLENKLLSRWRVADSLAVHYAQRFRSAFVANFLLAATAVFVGLLVVFFWESKGLKAIFVISELVLIATILYITWRGHQGRWRDRWLDYRNIAESLRPARLSILIGESPLRPGSSIGSNPGQLWVAWYVKAVLRELAPPHAVIGRKVRAQVLHVAHKEELEAQLEYHSVNNEEMKKLDQRLEKTAELALLATIASGSLYLLFYILYLAGWTAVVEQYKPLATILGGTLPVLGAAVFGIRATGDFRSAAQQSRRMTAQLEQLQIVLAAHQSSARHDITRKILGQITREMSEDLRVWGMIYSERELAPGF